MTTSVRLVAKTIPEPFLEATSDDFIAYVARVSNPSNQNNHETAPRLLKYLRDHKHWSPFEMAHAVLEITTTRDIARQILRHRSFSFQEHSQRYSSEIDFAEPREARLQDQKNRQNSIDITNFDGDRGLQVKDDWTDRQASVIAAAKEAYQWALSAGIAKEVARSVLPEGLTESRLYMGGTLRSWLHYIELRSDNGTQKEHREIALLCRGALAPAFPGVFA